MFNLQKRHGLSAQGAKNIQKGICWTVVVNLVVMAGMSLFYLAMRDLMAAATQDASMPALLPYILGCLVFLLLSFVTHVQQYINTYGTVYDEVSHIRISLAERLRKLPLSFFGSHDLADLTETMMSDVDKLEHVWSHVLSYLYGSIISTAIIAIGLFVFDWRLTLAALWSVPLAFVLLFGSQSWWKSLQDQARMKSLEVSDGMQEMLDNAREIHATNQIDSYLSRLNSKIDRAESTMQKAEFVGGLFINSAAVILRLGIATTILVGAYLISIGAIDFLTLFMFLLVISRIYAPFDQSFALIFELIMSKFSSARLNRFFDEPLATGGENFQPANHNISFEKVGFDYGTGTEKVLEDVSFVAREGEVTALVGPSGSGKSTCARLVARLWDANAGAVCIGGIDVTEVDPETLYGHISIVFQDVMLFDDSVMENIRIGRRDASDEEVLAAAAAANCDEFVERMPDGYQTLIGENGSRLSGGERQRISIARAMLKRAPIILLDEATASLDVENETKVQKALSKLLEGKTTLVIAHRMRTISNADKIVVLDEGHVVEQGSPADLLAHNGKFAHMVQLQNQSEAWVL